MKPVIIIPAYQPGKELIRLIEKIIKGSDQKVIIINDGSTGDSRKVFDIIGTHGERIDVLEHSINLGKGQALKTGLNHFLLKYAEECVGVVTADADGQHSVDDIMLVSDALSAHSNALCIGVRTFGKDIPIRSFIGNKLTAGIFKLITGQTLTDTQSGLRGIPKNFIHDLLHSTDVGYDFELDMLLMAIKSHRQIFEVPIQTIYILKNKNSHFDVLRDSLKIYSVFLRFISLSIVTAIIDYLVFAIIFWKTSNILAGIASARLIAGSFQFLLGKFWVFRSSEKLFFEMVKYALLVVLLMTLSYSLVFLLVSIFEFSPYIAKPLAEGIIFLLSFTAQNVFVYSVGSTSSKKTHFVP